MSDYFKGLAKVLTPNGRVAIIDFRKDAPDGPPPEFRFEAAQIIDEMTKAGYRLDVDHGFLPRQHFLVFRAPGFKPVNQRWLPASAGRLREEIHKFTTAAAFRLKPEATPRSIESDR